MPYVLEGIISTLDDTGNPHLVPMGLIPHESSDGSVVKFTLRPFPGSRTFTNLCERKAAVFHISDDPLILAQAIIHQLDINSLPLEAAKVISGTKLSSACELWELKISEIDLSNERASMTGEVLHHEQLRSFRGFNRACHAILEAAIYISRIEMLGVETIEAELKKLRPLVDKTGTEDAILAFELIEQYLKLNSPEGTTTQVEGVK